MSKIFKAYKIFFIIFILNIFPCNNSSFKEIKKISYYGDYLLISESELYIYNFQNSICDSILKFEENNNNNYYLI